MKRFLLELTPPRAFGVFMIALGASAAFIIADVGGPLGVLAPVVLYGGMLWYAQKKLFVALNGTLKDSPYFLGFTLTLVALVRLFWVASANPKGLASDPTSFVGGLALAIVTTAVGLVIRQALHSLDSGDAARDAAFQTLITSIRQNAADFHQAQQQLVLLVKEFVSGREDMFVSEQEAQAKYVRSLGSASEQLVDLEREWPARLGALQHAMQSSTAEFEKATRSVAALVDDVRSELDRAVAQAGEVVIHAATRGAETLSDATEGFRAQFVALTTALETLQQRLRAEADLLRGGLGDFRLEVERLPTDIKTIRAEMAGFRDELPRAAAAIQSAALAMSQVANNVRGLESELRRLHGEVQAQATAVVAEGQEMTEQVRVRTREMLDELKAVDTIIDDVVKLLQVRITQIPTGNGAGSRTARV